jgi:chromosome segregation ATPase
MTQCYDIAAEGEPNDVDTLARLLATVPEAEGEAFIRKAARRLARTNIALRKQLAETPGQGDMDEALCQSIKVRDAELRELKSEFDAVVADRDNFRTESDKHRTERDDARRRVDSLLEDCTTSETLSYFRRLEVERKDEEMRNLREDVALLRAERDQLGAKLAATEEPSHTSLEAMQAEGNAIDYSDIPF